MSATNPTPPTANQVVAPKKRRSRSPSQPRPAYIVIQVLGEDGQPMPFDKSRIHILSVERVADKVLELTEGDKNPNAFYLRVIVPAGRAPGPTGPRAVPSAT
jgi:hypothetical protein